MEKLPEVVDVRKKVSLPSCIVELLYDHGYRYIEVTEYGTLAFYFQFFVKLPSYSLYHVSIQEHAKSYFDLPFDCILCLEA